MQSAKTPKSRNSDWSKEEHILALDLYMRSHGKLPGRTSVEVEELSALLKKIGPALNHVMLANYRNPDGVAMKLQNFKRCDPKWTGAGKKGLSHGNEQELLVWQEFGTDVDALKIAAARLRAKFGG